MRPARRRPRTPRRRPASTAPRRRTSGRARRARSRRARRARSSGRGGARGAGRGGRRRSVRWRSSRVLLQVLFEGVEALRPVPRGRARASRRPRPAARRAARTSAACRRARTSTRPASRSTLRCLETPGWLRPQARHEVVDRSARRRAGDRGSRAGTARRGRRRRSSTDHITIWLYERVAGGRVAGSAPRGGLCLPHAPSPARPPPSTSPSSQSWPPCARGPRRWGRRRRSRRRLAARCGTGSAWWPAGSARRARRAPRGSRRAWCRRARIASGSAAGCWSCGSGAADALLVERRSDGSAAVSFADGGAPAATLGVGVRLLGRARTRAGVRAGRAAVQRRADVGVRELRRGGALRAPLGAAESLGGRGERLLRKACPVCRATRRPAGADATFREGGAYGEFAAALRGRARRGAIAGGEQEGEVGGDRRPPAWRATGA